jgi:hypothetical protein
LLAAVCVLSITGCATRASNRWQPQPDAPAQAAAPASAPATAKAESTPSPKPADKSSATRIVLFAPTAIAPIAAIYPEARTDYPYDLAQRVDLLVRDADGRAGERLPASDDAAWSKGRVAATAGAHVVVLSFIEEVHAVPGVSRPNGRHDTFVATARMVCLDVDGKEIYAKTATGEAEGQQSPKFMGASNRPECVAAWNALSNALGGVRQYLEGAMDISNQPHRASLDQAPAPAALVDVVIDSQPARADILVDGVYRGTTKQKLKLPERPVKIRLELAGYKPWEREMTPNPDMRVEPVLEPLAESAPAQEPAPADPAAAPAPAPAIPANP